MTADPSAGIRSIGVFGAGAWGTALAEVAARAGRDVTLVGRDVTVADGINRHHASPHLPGLALSSAIVASTHPGILRDVDLLVLATPAQATRAAIGRIAPLLRGGVPVVVAAKGIEQASGLLVAEVVAGIHERGPVAVLSGPGFAGEVAAGLPTAVTVAAEDREMADRLAESFAGTNFRPYSSTDVVGVQLGGALKNVLAIAAGIVGGRRLGASAEAAVITRGFVEMRRLAAAWGGRPETLMGLSGLGDLILTCRSTQSRNFSLGFAIGEGADPAQFGRLAEGAATAGIATVRAKAFAVDVPIMDAVADVIGGRADVDTAIERLLSRPLKRED